MISDIYKLFFSHVWNVGVEFGNSLKFDKHICSVIESNFFHLCLLAEIMPFLSEKTLEVAMLLLQLGWTATLCIMVF